MSQIRKRSYGDLGRPRHPRIYEINNWGHDLRGCLYVALDPWRWHCFRLEAAVPAEAQSEEFAG